MLQIYMYDMRKLDDEAEYEKMYERASKSRQEKALRGRRKEHIGAAAVLDMALREYGLSEKNTELTYGEHGKPYIVNRADTDSDIYFNISHSGDYVVCAVSDREVGIDIQKIGAAKKNIAERYFTQNEYMHIMNQPDEKSQNELFYRIWALKESFVKAVGTGMSLAFDSFEIKIDDYVTVSQSYNDSEYEFEERSIPGYVVAICSEIQIKDA